MAPVIPNSTSNVSINPGIPLTSKRTKLLSKCSFTQEHNQQTLSTPKYLTPLSTSIRLFPQFRIRCGLGTKKPTHISSASGTDVVVEETEMSEVGTEATETVIDASDGTNESSEKSDPSPARSKRPRASRKSDMPEVKNEELIPGASFTGKVRSIQAFGAFVDFGAFTDGLVHVSRLSDSFVKDVSSVVTVGQEVTVRLIEANFETGRISLSMRDSDDPDKQKQAKDSSLKNEKKSGPPRKTGTRTNQRKEDVKKTSKFVKGQDLQGTVKNLTRSGAFISLPEGEEGFLPRSEEADEGFGNMMGDSSLEVAQEVDVRVLRVNRGQVTLTMKKEEDAAVLDSKLSQGVVHKATNPFVLAFHSNKEISDFLDESKKEEELVESLVNDVKDTDSDISSVDGTSSETLIKEEHVDVPKDDNSLSNEVEERVEEIESSSDVITDDISTSREDPISEESAPINVENEKENEISVEANDLIEEVKNEEPDTITSSTVHVESELSEEISPIEKKEGSDVAVEVTDQISLPQSAEQDVEEKAEDVIQPSEISSSTEDGEQVETPNEEESDNLAAQVTSSTPETTSTAAISPALVKQLREESGAGMMDCKKALAETGGDMTKAFEYLRKKGLASADKIASRVTAEGRIGSYIHDSRIGVLIEVNCETDFVARGDIFKELVEDLAMQVAACPQVQYLNTEDVPKEIVDKETDIEMQKDDLLLKPEQFRAKIVEGRVRKRLEELALMEQPFIKDDKMVVKDWVKKTISTIGENIKVTRFMRYNLGEGLEKKSQDFAAEVAAQTAIKSVSTPANQEPAVSETTETTETPTKTAVSAALVKQLREETGAGMMDCKKALTETGGDLEKAHEYLRKKGLSTAEKKSKRLAAEGRIGSYIHDSRIGVLIEVNCETDFVGRSQGFKELVDDLAMQVVACPQVQYVSIEDIPERIVKKEKDLEMQREDLQSKPENIREKIVEGRITKRLGELALLEQPFIKDDTMLVKDLVKQSVATIGENIKVRRFVKFSIGEMGEKKDESEA